MTNNLPGERGAQGPRGLRGDAGLRGDTGLRGDPGTSSDEPEFDDHGGELKKTNPERLTPASQRVFRKIVASYCILVLCLVFAFWALTNRAENRARCAAWDASHLLALRTTDPVTVDDPRLTPPIVASRKLFNQEYAARRKKTLHDLGPRPRC